MPRFRSIRASLLAAFAVLAGAAIPAAAAPAASATIGEIRKEHNVAAPDGRTAVRLTVPADIVNYAGSTVWMAVTFTDIAGHPLVANDAGYADAAGKMRVASVDTSITKDRESLDFVFVVPYQAFPNVKGGRYQVIAHARLVRQAKPRNYAIALGTTVFWVEP